MAQSYFYDQQIRRWILQFMRVFGGFSVKMGKDANGDDYYHQVPVKYGDSSRMAAHIVKQNSENKINSVPMISCYIAELLPNAERRLQPTFRDRVNVFEKSYDEESDTYQDRIGETYTLERYSPVPYDLTINVDVWTSNTEQKLQLLEQMLLLFNPSVNLQSSDNPFDWTSIAWSARSIPQGTDDVIDVATLIFQLPIYLTPPAKVKRQVLIHSILANIYTRTDIDIDLDSLEFTPERSRVRQWITFKDRHIQVNADSIQLLTYLDDPQDPEKTDGSLLNWREHLLPYGDLKNGITEIRLRIGADPITENADEVVLVVSEVTGNPNLLSYEIDTATLPADTIPMINGVIDPQRSQPGAGSLPAAAAGQRYLITQEIVPFAGGPWGMCSADVNDIIEYNGTDWVVSFDASAVNVVGYTTNANTMKKLYYTGNDWVIAIEGIFEQGYWRIVN
jgi:hypothetical protein